MKKAISIFVLAFALSSSVSAQVAPKAKKDTIATQTTISDSGKDNFRIETSDEGIIKKLMSYEATGLVLRGAWKYGKDRLGTFKVYSFYFKNENKSRILNGL